MLFSSVKMIQVYLQILSTVDLEMSTVKTLFLFQNNTNLRE